MIDFKDIIGKIPIARWIPVFVGAFDNLSEEQKATIAAALMKLAVKAAENYLKK